MIQDPHAEPFHPGAHAAHVFGSLHTGAQGLAGVGIHRERVAALDREPVHVRVRLVEDAVHPIVVGQISAQRLTAGLGIGTGGDLGRDVPDAGAGRSCGAAGSAVSLVHQRHLGPRFPGVHRRPARGGAAADHQHVGTDLPWFAHRHVPPGRVGVRNGKAARRSHRRVRIRAILWRRNFPHGGKPVASRGRPASAHRQASAMPLSHWRTAVRCSGVNPASNSASRRATAAWASV